MSKAHSITTRDKSTVVNHRYCTGCVATLEPHSALETDFAAWRSGRRGRPSLSTRRLSRRGFATSNDGCARATPATSYTTAAAAAENPRFNFQFSRRAGMGWTGWSLFFFFPARPRRRRRKRRRRSQGGAAGACGGRPTWMRSSSRWRRRRRRGPNSYR